MGGSPRSEAATRGDHQHSSHPLVHHLAQLVREAAVIDACQNFSAVSVSQGMTFIRKLDRSASGDCASPLSVRVQSPTPAYNGE